MRARSSDSTTSFTSTRQPGRMRPTWMTPLFSSKISAHAVTSPTWTASCSCRSARILRESASASPAPPPVASSTLAPVGTTLLARMSKLSSRGSRKISRGQGSLGRGFPVNHSSRPCPFFLQSFLSFKPISPDLVIEMFGMFGCATGPDMGRRLSNLCSGGGVLLHRFGLVGCRSK